MTQLTKDTPVPIVWLWMFIAGLGVGPTFSVLTIVIQNAVPFQRARRRDVEPDVLPPDRRHDRPRLRRARSSARRSRSSSSRRWRRRACRRRSLAGLRPGERERQLDFSSLTGVGDLGAAILAACRRSSRRSIAPVIRHDRRGHPRGVQPRDRPDVLARRGRRGRRGSSRPSRSRRSRSATTNEAPVPTAAVADGGRRQALRSGQPAAVDRLATSTPHSTRRPRLATRPGSSFVRRRSRCRARIDT